MVLLHGITNSWRTWLPVLPALESEHDVLALTLAGHYGAAPLPAGVTASVSALTDAAERALDEAGFDAAHLVGNSLGGWIAFELAKRRRAASVVAFSPAGGRPRTSPEEARRVARKIDLGFRLARVLSPVAGPLTRFPIGRRALFSQLAAHPERIPPQEAAYRLRALAGCAVLPGLLASIVGAPAERLDEIRCPGAVGLADRRSRAPKGAVRPEFAVRPARSAVARAARHRPHADVRRSRPDRSDHPRLRASALAQAGTAGHLTAHPRHAHPRIQGTRLNRYPAPLRTRLVSRLPGSDKLPLRSENAEVSPEGGVALATEQDQLSAARQGQHCPSPRIAGAGHLLGLAAAGRPSKRWEEVWNIADRLLETDLRRSQLMIWPFTTAVAIA